MQILTSKLKNNSEVSQNQGGQTLIETLVAAIVLVMGISAAVGLAVYGLGATTGVSKQLIGIGLAREGVEAVKNMRDTNWLRTNISTNCFDFYTQSSIANCYKNWLDGASGSGAYQILTNLVTPQTYNLGFDSTVTDSGNYWVLTPTNTLFGLDYTPNNSSPELGLYTPNKSTALGTSDFSRKITLSTDSFAPFDLSDLGPRVKVHVDVWWKDKNCPASNDVPASSKCKISLETYLTNWKNF